MRKHQNRHILAEPAGKDTENAASRINPLFPALRSGPTTAPGASLQKQIPSSDIESFVKVMIEDFAAPEVLGDVTSLQGEISGVVRRLLDKAMAAKASFCFKIRRLMHNTSGTGKGSPPSS